MIVLQILLLALLLLLVLLLLMLVVVVVLLVVRVRSALQWLLVEMVVISVMAGCIVTISGITTSVVIVIAAVPSTDSVMLIGFSRLLLLLWMMVGLPNLFVAGLTIMLLIVVGVGGNGGGRWWIDGVESQRVRWIRRGGGGVTDIIITRAGVGVARLVRC